MQQTSKNIFLPLSLDTLLLGCIVFLIAAKLQVLYFFNLIFNTLKMFIVCNDIIVKLINGAIVV